MVKNIIKSLNGKYSPKLFDPAKQSATDLLKAASDRAIAKTAELTGDLIGYKIADKITKASRTSPQNNSEAVANEEENIGFDREMPREIYISRKKTDNY